MKIDIWETEVNKEINKKLIEPIYNRIDIIKQLLEVIRVSSLHSDKKNEDSIKIYVVNKYMSRIFIETDNKITSFVNPFRIEKSGKLLQFFYFETIIDSRLNSALDSIINDIESNQTSYGLDELAESIYNILDDYELHENYDICCLIIKELLTYETGYLRYDVDDLRVSEIHPLHHIDVCFSNKSTYKIGLRKKMKFENLKDFLDKTKDCLYIS